VINYEQLRTAVDTKLSMDPELRTIMKRINSGRATFIDTARYSQVLSHILGSEVSKMILNVDDREAVVSHLLHDSYEDINDVFGRVQRDIDKKKGLNIKPRQGEYPDERVEQFVHSLVDPTVEDSVIERRARAGTETITKSFHDDCIEENAKLHEEAGLKTYIIRMGTNCCPWCSEVAGKYEMKDQPQGIFRRHDNCDCTVIYDGQVLRGQTGNNGKRSKKWVEVPKDAGAAAAPRLSQEQARKLTDDKVSEVKSKISNPSEMTIKQNTESQYYRPVLLDHNSGISINREYEFSAYKVENTHNNVYVSENVDIKPKKLHQIDIRISEAMNKIGISDEKNLPKAVVVSRKDIAKNDVALYRAKENMLLICDEYAVYSPAEMPRQMQQLACGEKDISTYIHELYHWLDAEEYRNKYGNITDENYNDYIDFINNNAKKRLDKLSSKGYNVLVSKYAKDNVIKQQFFEVYTEYRTFNLLEG